MYYADEHRDKNLIYRMSWEEYLSLFPPDSSVRHEKPVNGILRMQLIYDEISRIRKKMGYSSLKSQVLSEFGVFSSSR